MKHIWLFFLAVCSVLMGYGQSYKLYTADKELSSSLINCIYQDRRGFIWIATEDGLNRYDGAKFTVYKHEIDNPRSLMDNYVKAIFETTKGDLIIGTFSGIQMYNPSTDDFSLPAKSVLNETFSLVTGSIMEKRNGEIWIASPAPGRLSIKGEELVVDFLNLPIPKNHFPDQFEEDAVGNIWVAVGGVGVYKITAYNRIKLYLGNIKNLHSLSLCKDSDGNIYVGSLGRGLFKYDSSKDDFDYIPYKDQNLPIKSLISKSTDELFIGTDGKGIKIFDKKKNEIVDYPIRNYRLKLDNAKVHSMLRDKDGSLWIGLYQKGIIYQPMNPNNFKYIGYRSIDRNIIGNCCITCILKDSKDFLWVGSDNDGIYRISKDKQQSVHYPATGLQGAPPAAIFCLYEDSESNLWFGSYTRGIGKIDPETGKCTFIDKLKDNNGNPIPVVFDITEDRQKRLWITTMGHGLYCYDLKSGDLKCMNDVHTDLLYWLSNLHYSSSKNKLFVGGYGGLDCIDLGAEDISCTHLLSAKVVHCISEDDNGIVWIGTSEGLYSLNVETKDLNQYTVKDGLASNVIYAVQHDEQNRLWISTNSGMSCYQLQTGQFMNYYVSDGLQGNEFYKNSSYKDKDGILWFGGMNGLTYFKPDEIYIPNKKWNARISDFFVYDKAVRKRMLSGNKEIIDRPVYETKDFYLSYKDNTFSIEFSTVELNKPERLVYMYSLNDGDWINLPHGVNRVSFSNLSPGTYTFRVKTKDGMIESDVTECMIHISFPWWATIWAKLLYICLALAVVVIGIYQLKRYFKNKKEKLERIHAEEINNAKLQFFINISHEIRTPLSLVVSPLVGLINSDKDESRQKIYNTIYRNVQRLLLLVNQLMDIRKIEKNQMKLHFREVDIVGYIKQIYESFTLQASAKNIDLKFDTHGYEKLGLWIDPAYFDKIIVNILSNALKFTAKGSVGIELNTTDNGKSDSGMGYVEIRITDTGIGIDEKEYEHIFERFYQVHNSLSAAGTGIGLHLVQSLVKLHHGEISVGKNPYGDSGTSFLVRIPLGNSHLSSDEVCENTDDDIVLDSSSAVVDIAPAENPDLGVSVHAKTKWKVCIVEDDDEIREYIKNELSSVFHVIGYRNGKEAWSNMLKDMPDLIISDVMMPEMDGFTLCEKIKRNVNLNHLPVILLTAKTEDDSNIKGLDIGADAYITKPFNIKILSKTVENLILKHQKMQNIFTGRQGQDDKLDKLEAKSPDEKLMERIMKVINDNLSNPELTVDVIVNEVGISRSHLHRKLKELTNQPTRQFIRNIRLKQAAQLLADKRHSIAEVAQMTGFSNPNNFSTLFKELYGVTPSEYMEQHLQENK